MILDFRDERVKVEWFYNIVRVMVVFGFELMFIRVEFVLMNIKFCCVFMFFLSVLGFCVFSFAVFIMVWRFSLFSFVGRDLINIW